MSLLPLQTWFQPGPGPLLPQLREHLAAVALHQAGPGARALRWAITSADPARGLQIEAVLILAGDAGGCPPPTAGPVASSPSRAEPGSPC